MIEHKTERLPLVIKCKCLAAANFDMASNSASFGIDSNVIVFITNPLVFLPPVGRHLVSIVKFAL